MMDLFLFDKNKEVIDIITPDSIYESEQPIELNGLITHTVSGVYTDAVEDAEFFGMKDVDDNGIFWRYKVSGLRKSDGNFTLDGTYELFDDLKSRTVIQDKRPQNQTALNALNTLLEGTTWEVGNVSSERVATSNWYYISPLEAFWDYLEKWNVEFKPRMVYSGGKVIRKVIDISDRLSDDYGKWYEYGSDLLTVVAEEDKANIYTAFIGRGKGEETDAGGYGRRLTIEEVEWSTANGDPVDKLLGQNYIEILEATALYGYEDGTPRFTTVTFEDIDDRNELIRATYDYAVQEARPKAQFKATVHEDGAAEVGEIVTIIRDDLNIRYKTRVFKLTRNFLNKRIKQLEFGDELVQSRAKQSKAIADRFNKKIEETNVFWLDALREAITDSYFNNDGYNYDLQADNEYGLPGGYYSFDRPIDENPTKAIYMGAGTLLISNEKNPNGEWVWRTALNGEGIMADWIVGYNSEFVRSSWNQGDTNVQITGEGLETSDTNSTIKTLLKNGIVEFQDGIGDIVGGISTSEIYALGPDDNYHRYKGITVQTHAEKYFGVHKQWTADGDYLPVLRTAIRSPGLEILLPLSVRSTLNMHDQEIHYAKNVRVSQGTGLAYHTGTSRPLLVGGNGSALGYGNINSPSMSLIVDTDGNVSVEKNSTFKSHVSVQDVLNMNRNRIDGVERLLLGATTNGLKIDSGRPYLDGDNGVLLGFANSTRVEVLNSAVRFHRSIDLNGNEILNRSDIRLKENIHETQVKGIEETKRLRMVDFDWKKGHERTEGFPEERQFGMIAQDTPFLSRINGDEDHYLSIDLVKQINLNTLTNQEVISMVENLSKRVEELEGNGR